MACNINGSCCKVCPGMWIAAILFLVMIGQSWFGKSQATSKTAPVHAAANSGLPDAEPNPPK